MKNYIFAYVSIKLGVFLALLFGVFFLFLPSRLLAAPGTDKMLGYWKFDNNIIDSSGDGNLGYLSASDIPQYVTDIPVTSFSNSKSLYFPSEDSYFEVTDSSAISPTNEMSFSFWVRIDALPTFAVPGDKIIIAGNRNSIELNKGYYFSISTSHIYFNAGGIESSFPLSEISLGSWFHLAGSYDGLQSKIYLNGVEKNVNSGSSLIDYTNTYFKLGNFIGKVDDVRVYGRALNGTEIADLALGKHTSSIWTGTVNSDYENFENWEPVFIPDPFTKIIIPTALYTPIFTQNEAVAGIKIEAGSSLDIDGFNLTINDSGSFSNDGTLKLKNLSGQIISGFINDINSGETYFYGDSDLTVFKTGNQYYNLTIDKTNQILSPTSSLTVKGNLKCSEGSLHLQGEAIVHGNIILNGGTLINSTSSPINIFGDWVSSGSFFNPSSGEVNFVGNDQQLTGQNNFYNLNKTTLAANTLSLNGTQVIKNNLLLRGGVSSILSLRSSVGGGVQWEIYPMGGVNISFLDVKDSKNLSGSVIDATSGNIINSGNNTNWLFDVNPPNLTLSSVTAVTSNMSYPITGTVSDSNIISAVYASLDELNWSACSASDGSFNELAENFSCILGLNNGLNNVYFKSSDILGNVTSVVDYPSVVLTVDTDAPVVTSISATAQTESVAITWVTDKDSSSIVDYGTTSTYGQSTVEKDVTVGVKNHSVTISGLTACTNYHYRVRSRDSVLNQGISTDQAFATGGCSTALPVNTEEEESSCKEEKPGEPEITSTEAKSSTSIVLEIDEASGTVDNYKIKYGKSSDNLQWSVDDIDEDEIDSFIIDDLLPETTYYFKVRAENECENGDWSDEESEITEKESAIISTATTDDNLHTTSATTALTSPNDPAIQESVENILNPLGGTLEDSSKSKTQLSSEEAGIGSNDEDKSEEREDIRKKDIPITKECGASTVEMVEGISGEKKLKIKGFGPPNADLKVYVYSDNPVVLGVRTDKDGNWSYVLENELENGEHQVYVVVDDDSGELKAKSNPLAFIKTAQAVSDIRIISDAQAASPTERAKSSFPVLFVFISVATLLLALIIIGWRIKSQRKEELI